ncbi:hypothetical protein [Collinsella bouchesdurhonensis]|uniref:hypothetical protein n=1 Tax=Collinsella bouchesdurhonensis TaxID=1907654 RepID=UPI00110576FA|nr:hypothetical protein [Collinsella bouchesdurhonensis]
MTPASLLSFSASVLLCLDASLALLDTLLSAEDDALMAPKPLAIELIFWGSEPRAEDSFAHCSEKPVRSTPLSACTASGTFLRELSVLLRLLFGTDASFAMASDRLLILCTVPSVMLRSRAGRASPIFAIWLAMVEEIFTPPMLFTAPAIAETLAVPGIFATAFAMLDRFLPMVADTLTPLNTDRDDAMELICDALPVIPLSVFRALARFSRRSGVPPAALFRPLTASLSSMTPLFAEDASASISILSWSMLAPEAATIKPHFWGCNPYRASSLLTARAS